MAKPSFEEGAAIKSMFISGGVATQSNESNDHCYGLVPNVDVSTAGPPLKKQRLSLNKTRSKNAASRTAIANDKEALAVPGPPSRRAKLSGKQISCLSLVCCTSIVSKVSTGYFVQEEDITALPTEIEDDIINTDCGIIKSFLTSDAWMALQNVLQVKQNEWKCSACPVVTTHSDMIQCDNCGSWFHQKCEGVTTPPPEAEDWFCSRCIKM